MSRPSAWTPVESEPLLDARVFQVVRDQVRSPRDHQVYDFFRIEAAHWVNVVPVTPEGQIVMVAQYRHGSRRITLEIPGGMVDAGEDPAVSAGRELLEETGYQAARIERLGDVSPNPALFGNRLHMFVAHDVAWKQEIENSSREETSIELVSRSALPGLVRAGEIDHALVVATLFWFEYHRKEDASR